MLVYVISMFLVISITSFETKYVNDKEKLCNQPVKERLVPDQTEVMPGDTEIHDSNNIVMTNPPPDGYYSREKKYMEEPDTNVNRGTVIDYDGNIYNTVIIGNREWMAENLKTTTYRNGIPIHYPGDKEAEPYWTECTINQTGAYAWYDNDPENANAYGALYNWYAVNSGNLCPTGWRLPDEDDWDELINYIIDNTDYTLDNVANALKSCRQINSPLGGDFATIEHPRWNSHGTHHGTDDYSFSALPGGSRHYLGNFQGIGNYGVWWLSTESLTTYAYYRGIYYYHGTVYSYIYHGKDHGFSVRCIRDVD